MKSNKKLLIILSIVIILILVIVFVYMNLKPHYRSVKLEEYDGTVTLTRQDKEVETYKGIMLIPLDMVETMQDSFAALNVDNDKHLGVEENTKLCINATGTDESGKVTIDLAYGEALFEIENKLNDESFFEVNTQNAILSVRGTTFKAAYDKDELMTRLDVMEGIVNVTAGDITLDVKAGESVVIKGETVYTVKKENGTETLEPYSGDGNNGVEGELPQQDDVWDENRAWTDRDDILPREENGFIVFGAYEQDGDLTNGPEPIQWEIFDNDSNGTLLLSYLVLDSHQYHETYTDVTWETCTLRQWLNNEFMNKAFTKVEQDCILSVTISTPDNARKGTPGGNATTDKLFLLSEDDILNHYTFEKWNDKDMFGFSSEVYFNITNYCDRSSSWYWLRSPGPLANRACFVGSGGDAGWAVSNNVNYENGGIRPAIYIKQ